MKKLGCFTGTTFILSYLITQNTLAGGNPDSLIDNDVKISLNHLEKSIKETSLCKTAVFRGWKKHQLHPGSFCAASSIKF